MAGDWLKMRVDLLTSPKVVRISTRLGIDKKSVIVSLYWLSVWITRQGKYGRIESPVEVIDTITDIPGFGKALQDEDWLRIFANEIEIRGFFKPHTERKSLGKTIRKKLITPETVCSICGSRDRLEIDHIVPISRGGNSEIDNLQVLCFPCNRSKGANNGG